MSFSAAGCMRKMCDDEIRALFDEDPRMTVKRLALIAGKSVDEIKKILMDSK